jgi:Zinc carboxypeptidase
MRRKLLAAVTAALALAVGAQAADAKQAQERLDAYTAVVDAEGLAAIAEAGFDASEGTRRVRGGTQVHLIMTADQREKLAAAGVNARLTRVRGGQTVQQFAARMAANGFNVWRSYDEDGGIEDQMRAAARNNPRIAELVKLGRTYQGRDILAVRLTEDAHKVKDGKRPAVLYSSTQHAREWISTEVNRRLMFHYINEWRSGDKSIRRLLEDNELWFILVANPDGYEYTFTNERLWRKNLRDNDGNGEIAVGDGVDPNRNFPAHFKYDNEGSSSIFSSETYRGPHATSEPETKAMKGLLDRVDFSFQVNWHSNGQWLLYAEGWQVGTATADDPIYFAMSGNLDDPAIEDFHPGLSSDVLYVTNGETTDYAHAETGALAWTPELSEGCDGCGFVFPDDEALVEEEFQRNLPFAVSVAKSAADPDDPETVTGIETKPFYVKSDDAYKDGIPGVNFAFEYSYGDPQTVQVLAKRSLGRVELKYRINNGRTHSAETKEWRGGEKYKPAAVHYHELRGTVRGADPGDTVKVWFEGDEGRRDYRSESFTYQQVSDSGRKVLVVAAEDYTGASPPQPGVTAPKYLSYYLDAIRAAGYRADVYDVDARGRTAPDHLGVLSHYDAVVWYTGDDLVTRRTGWTGGNADRLAQDMMLEVRAYMNEHGNVLYTGPNAAQQYVASGAAGQQFYDPKGEGPCLVAGEPNPAFDPRRCLGLFGSPNSDGVMDVLEYWLGAYALAVADGHTAAPPATSPLFNIGGIDDPFSGLSWGFTPPGDPTHQEMSASFVSTSGILPRAEYPQFNSWPSARWDKPGGPFAPHTGTQYVYSQIADVSYKRLTREIAVPAAGGDLTFWTSYDTEHDWDFLFVEARTPGGDDWTTLPDANGHTSDDTGPATPPGGQDQASCPAGWAELHPQLMHYQTETADGLDCTPTGTTGVWNAASGNSGGWQEWRIDLDAYSGETVEISIAYVSDWAVQNLGVFLDDVTLPDGTTTSFEADLGGWTAGQPDSSGTNANNWIRTDASGFPVGATISTPDSLLFGFGFEGISTETDRNAVMRRSLRFLLD